MVAAHVTPTEHAAWQEKGGGSGRVSLRPAAGGDGADAHVDRAGPRRPERGHPPGNAHRQQPEPVRTLGEHACLDGRGGGLEPGLRQSQGSARRPAVKGGRFAGRCTVRERLGTRSGAVSGKLRPAGSPLTSDRGSQGGTHEGRGGRVKPARRPLRFHREEYTPGPIPVPQLTLIAPIRLSEDQASPLRLLQTRD